jgi:hypothetical protein
MSRKAKAAVGDPFVDDDEMDEDLLAYTNAFDKDRTVSACVPGPCWIEARKCLPLPPSQGPADDDDDGDDDLASTAGDKRGKGKVRANERPRCCLPSTIHPDAQNGVLRSSLACHQSV